MEYLEKIKEIEKYAKDNFVPIIKKEAIEYIFNIFDSILNTKIEEKKEKEEKKEEDKNIKLEFNILELGTAIAYSAIRFIIYILQKKKKIEEEYSLNIDLKLSIYTCEKDKFRFEIAKKNIEDINKFIEIKKYINIYNLEAVEFLEKIKKEERNESENIELFDVIFIDANKSAYLDYYLLSKDLKNKKGFLIFDNILFNGWVFGEYKGKKHRSIVNNLRKFISFLNENEIEYKIIEKADGILLI